MLKPEILKKVKKVLLNNIELVLTSLGIGVILLSDFFASRNNLPVAAATAISATLVGVIHGILFWLLRRRQRWVRQEAINQIREMLEDLLKNRLQTIRMSLYIVQAYQPEQEERTQQNFDRVYQILREINYVVDHISEESLTSWRHRYQHTLRYIESTKESTARSQQGS